MLTVDLARLEREGPLRLEAELPEDDPCWDGSGLRFARPVAIVLSASLAGSGEVVVRGGVRSGVAMACRRCLEEVSYDLDEQVTLVFAPADLLADEEGDVRVLEPGARLLDVLPALREEILLAVPNYVVCDDGCRGLCGGCGANLNDETCQCVPEGPDPRWAALDALRNE
ncbi:MAG: DUF177 domain-containing protein [Gemmatimonadetes bacterium]|nr:MAG: DUF177 domain-containing protein [Gemmatimonadota bacterium]